MKVLGLYIYTRFFFQNYYLIILSKLIIFLNWFRSKPKKNIILKILLIYKIFIYRGFTARQFSEFKINFLINKLKILKPNEVMTKEDRFSIW